jgi:hypothetical protein
VFFAIVMVVVFVYIKVLATQPGEAQ